MGQEKKFFSGTLTLNYYEGEPNGPNLMFLPALSGGICNFKRLLPYFEAKFHVFVLEFRGHGKSDRSDDYRLSGFIDDARQFINKIVKEPMTIYGHSLGGRVTMALLLEFPDLIQCPIIGDQLYENLSFEELRNEEGYQAYYELLHQLRELYAANMDIVEKREQLIRIRGEDSRQRYSEMNENDFCDPKLVTILVEKHGVDGINQGYRRKEVEAYLSQYQKPILFIYAKSTLDGFMKNYGIDWEKDLREMTDNRENVAIEVVEFSHWLQVDNPEAVAMVIKEFLQANLEV